MNPRVLTVLLLLGPQIQAAETQTVRVAAIQCSSAMGKTAANTEVLERLVRDAAAQGARIMVLPECAVQGYMDPTKDLTWTGGEPGAQTMGLAGIAEPVPGPSTTRFAKITAELGIFCCLPLVEQATAKDGSLHYYNSQILLGPQGTVLAHHRKQNLWPSGDANWCTPGDRPVQVVDTPYGRIGLMICYDVHLLPPRLAEAKADLVLYSVGWVSLNPEGWFRYHLPRRAVIPHGFHVVAANWSCATEPEAWSGCGFSCVIRKDGEVLAMARTLAGSEIVFADLEVPLVTATPEPGR